MKMATNIPAAKVQAGTTASAVSVALMTIFLWGAGEIWPAHPIPLLVQGALLTLVTGACTFLAAYFVPPAERDQVVGATRPGIH